MRSESLARNPKTTEWETGQAASSSAAAIEEWRRKHPAQALALRTGLNKPPADLQRLEQTYAETGSNTSARATRSKMPRGAWE